MLPMFVSGVVLLFIDQWSKRTVQTWVHGRGVCLGPVVRIRFVTSLKKIYGRRLPRIALVLVWCAAVVSTIALHRSGAWFQTDVALLGLGLAIGGAAGNLVDILRWRYVVDFIDLQWWPVFNLADVAVILGLVMAFWPQA